MSLNKFLFALFCFFLLSCTAQISGGKNIFEPELNETQQNALVELQQMVGAPVSIEIGDFGNVKVIEMQEGFSYPSNLSGDAKTSAEQFLNQNKNLFNFDQNKLLELKTTKIDVDDNSSHIIFQRHIEGIPVYQGTIAVHLDNLNNIYRVIGNDFYNTEKPTNRFILTPIEALIYAGSYFNLELEPQLINSTNNRFEFIDFNLHDAIVEKRVFQLTNNTSKFVYQIIFAWNDVGNNLQHELVMIDAENGELLYFHTLVDSFRGKVFIQDPSLSSDNRQIVSFDGDPNLSPAGWIGNQRTTVGNNVFAATDLNGNNTFGSNEIQPFADSNGDFLFPWSPAQSDTNFKESAVVNSFFHVNEFHDRTYRLGFTEGSGNFQTNNFGRGGFGNDSVIVDVQDGSGTNNANFSTPPDGNKPRMQMFVWTASGGRIEDGDFDSSIIYHENAHGLSNRLVGNGDTGCLFGKQSGGMGEGWSDYMAATFRNNPVIGGYAVSNNIRGIRNAPMDDSPFTYANIKDGSMTQVHDAGEIWAATLWSIREVIGAETTDQLIVSGMKLTPCNPTMLQARNAILQADVNLFGGANKCTIWRKFADRQMGVNASSPNHNSTASITLSSEIPSDCNVVSPPPPGDNTSTQTFSAAGLPLAIPDNNLQGITSNIQVPSTLGSIKTLKLDLDITHTFRGDLEVTLKNTNGDQIILSNRQGGGQDNIKVTGFDLTNNFVGKPASGTWSLLVRDLEIKDNGTLNLFRLTFTTTGGETQTTFQGTNTTTTAIPDANTNGVNSLINVPQNNLQVQSVQVKLNIQHPFRGDLLVKLISPNGETRTVIGTANNDSNDNIVGVFNVQGFTVGSNASGNWKLNVADHFSQDVGNLISWSLGINSEAP
jgi:extracellular elastinolytic metalloproteinase